MSDRPVKKWKKLRGFGEESPEVVDIPDLADEMVPEAELEEEVETSEPLEAGPQRVLVALPSAPTSRLVRETLESFTDARVETTSDPVRAFEMALQKSYRVFFFAMEIGEMSGPLLYELIAKACGTGHGPRRIAPGVIFVRESRDVAVSDELVRDARVKDILSKPIRIDRLLRAIEGILETRDPTSRK